MLFGMDCLFIIATFILTFLLGLPFLLLIPSSHFKNKYLISPIFGYGFAGFLATVLYKFGVTHHHLYQYLWGASLLILFVLFYKRRSVLNLISTNSKTVFFVTLMWLSALIIILIPYWVGGLQFSVFQGWIHDNFSYLGAALTYSHETFKEVNQSSGEFFLRSPVSLYGAIELYRRPTIEHIFGLLSSVEKREMYRFGYLFLGMLVANGILAATFLITNVFKSSIFRALIVSIAIFVGFWGQTYIDFNAWSMTGAMPLLLATVAYIVVAARNIQNNSPLTLLELLPLSFLIGFALYIYPENTIFHMPALLAILMVANLFGLKIKISKSSLISTAKVLIAILLGFALSVFYFKGTMAYFAWAAGFSAQNVMTEAVYGDYLQAFFGQANWFRPLFDNAVAFSNATVKTENQGVVLLYILKQIFIEKHFEFIYYAMVDGFYGFLGMYFFTPLASLSQFTQECWRALLAIVIILFFCFNFKAYVKTILKFRLFFIFVAVISCMLLVFLLTTRIYGMARGLYYLAPCGMILFFMPFLVSEKVFTFKNSFFIFLLLSQFGFGLARIDLAAAHQFPIYPLPYALARTHYFIDGRMNYDWNLSRFDSAIKNCHRIYVNVPNGWQEYDVTFYLFSKGKEFVKKAPVKTSYWAVEIVGNQKLNGKEDCIISASKKMLANNKEFNELHLDSYRNNQP